MDMIKGFEQVLDGRVLHQRRIGAHCGHALIHVLLCSSQEQAEDRSLSDQAQLR